MYSIILLSGGTGSRMHNPIPKQYMLLAGKPVIMHSIERIDKIEDISEMIIVCADEYVSSIRLMLEQYGISKSTLFATAGESRQASVLSGLQKVTNETVIIHEAARPFVKTEDFNNIISEPCENVSYGLQIPFTVIKGKEYLQESLNRDELRNVQLPQKFNKELLRQSHEKALKDGLAFTEDATLVAHYVPSTKIKIISGMEYNLKLTTRMDLLLGEQIYEEYFRRKK